MKTHTDSDKVNTYLGGFVAALITLFVFSGTALAIQCYECHGNKGTADYRPVDAAYRNITTGGFQGSHQTHMASNATPSTCAVCHPGSSSYTTSHRDGAIKLSGHINSSPLITKYNNITSVIPQSATPVLSSCTNVNCHFETTTPTWGVAPLAAPTDCNKCHGAPPADGNHPAAAGSGKKHGDYYTTTTSSCVKCHVDHTAEAKPFAHATSAGNRGLLVQFTVAPNSGAGVYGGTVTYPNYLPSQLPPRNGSCRGLYCHSTGSRGFAPYTSNTTATWGGSLTCKGCHKADLASGDPFTTSSHRGHVNGTGIGYTQIKCVKCHAATVNSSMTIINTGNHVNGQVTVAFNNTSSAANGYYNTQLAKPASPSTKAPGSAVGQCTSVYCHSSGQGDGGTWPPIYQSPTWGTTTSGQCGTCHGIQTKHDASGFGYGTATPLTTGSHTRHLAFDLGTGNVSAERKCAACHAYTLTGYAPNACSSTVCHNLMPSKHANYEINVGIPDYYGATATYNAASLTPGTGYSTCSNVYCHSDGKATPTSYYTPTWGTPASGACGTCHGVTAAAPPASTPHVKHVGSASPYRFACAECHSGKVQVTANSTIAPTFTNTTSHVNKVRDVKFDPTNPFGTYSSAITTCRNLYCHSTGNTNVAAGNLPGVYGGSVYVRQGWTGTMSCNSCHGRSTTNGMPDYTNAGAVGSATSNSHSKHVTSSNIQCVECHEKTTKTGTSIRSTTPSYHTNGGRNVFFNLSGNNASGSYNGTVGQKNCTSTYCHGAGTSLSWGGTTYCNSCHSANAGTSGGGGINNWGTTPISAHKLHVEDTTTLPSKYTNYSTGNLGTSTTYRFGCASCHNPASATHVSGYASGTYRAQVFFGYTSPGKKPTYTYTGTAGTADNGFAWSNGNTVCNQTYCHSNGAGGTGAAVTWTTTVNSATNTRCKTCHGYTTASGSAIASGTHSKHINSATYTFSCRKCHGATTADGTSITDKTKHVNKAVNIAFNNTTTAVNGTYNGSASPVAKTPGSAYASCTNVYCHSTGTSTTPSTPNVTATWGGTLNTTCSGCHGNDSTATFKMGTVGSAAHTKHVQSYGFGCVKCHAATVSDNRTIVNYANHVNRQVDIAFNNTTTAVNGTYNGSASPMSKLPGSAYGACGNTYCHSNGTSVATSVIPANTSVSWGTAGPLPCTSCHGAGGTTGAPYYSKLMRVPTAQSGGTNWTTPGDALLGNKTFATYANTAQNPLILTSLGYTTAQVADTDTITGITVIVEGWAASATTPGNQLNVQLTQNGAAGVGTAKVISLPGTTSAADAEVYTTTNTIDLWGTTWTPAQIRATTFGVILKDNDTTSSQLNVDLVRVIVHTSKAPKMNNHSSARGHRVATCDICHTSVTYSGGVYTPNATLHVNRSYNVQASLGYTFATNGGTCSTPGNGCHGPTSGKWGGTLGCVDCHNKTITRTKGRPGAILADVVHEFGLAWGHKNSNRNPVTDDDCIVCHLEGDGTTHKASIYHQDGNIDLRDPLGAGETPIKNISGGTFTFQRFSTSYAAGSRTSTGQTSNTDIANVITQKFCLACHSSTGATNPTARSNNGGTGTATMPFGGINLGANYTVANGAAAAGGLVDVNSEFALTNTSIHPVRGPLNKDFPTAARLNDPYKPSGTRGTSATLSNSVVINCFDCHNVVGTPLTLRTVTAHGNAVTIRGVATVSGTPSAANDVTFCKVCHAGYVTGNAGHNAGSAFSSNPGQSGMYPYVSYGCNMCHSSNFATAVVRPVRAMDVHGVSVLPAGSIAKAGRWASVGTPIAFIRNNYNLSNHQPRYAGGTTYTPQCGIPSGTCAQSAGENYSVGGTY